MESEKISLCNASFLANPPSLIIESTDLKSLYECHPTKLPAIFQATVTKEMATQ